MSFRLHFLTSFLLVLLTAATGFLCAQAPERMTSAEIHHAIKKLGVLGTALYVAAHPDDENTRLISHLANKEKVHTTYLSLTRGDGGQNLVGPEIGELLGVIRTQELLMARRIDGGHQLFARANDFGYSKTPEETISIWNRDEVMWDVVWAIRKVQPDIIVNRFPHEHLNGNHGHHTASGMLAYEAFELAGDPAVFPGQLKYVDTWKPKRLFFNTSWWFYGSPEAFEEADKGTLVEVDVGNYYPMFGESNAEIAARSRSMHKSQGFGSSGSRGSVTEYLEVIKGDVPETGDLFTGIDISWARVDAGAHVGPMVYQIDADFDHEKPYASIPALLEVEDAIDKLPPSIWKTRKSEEVQTIIRQCMGLFAEVVAADYWATPGDSITLSCELTNRSPVQLVVVSAKFGDVELLEHPHYAQDNDPLYIEKTVLLPENTPMSSPYWLQEPWSEGMYTVSDRSLRGLPEKPLGTGVTWQLQIGDATRSHFTPLRYKRTDPVKGEVYRPFEVVPPAFVNIGEQVYICADREPKSIEVRVKNVTGSLKGTLSLEIPDGWAVAPVSHEVNLAERGAEGMYTFQLTPPEKQQIAEIKAVLEANGKILNQGYVELAYDHIPNQVVTFPAVARVVKVDLQRAGNKIGYITGAGDEVPASLQQVGYQVNILDENNVTLNALQRYDAVIIGVRAYNTSDRIRFLQPDLFAYVKGGGTLITQYNTSRGLKTDQLAPFDLTLSRDRVTDETADVTILQPDHAVMHYPNEISAGDFDHWVQERGLYFPGEWDEAFTPILQMHDPGEDPTDGSLLIANYGEGHFVYTGLSWFRQLPAGVPGAFRIFTNLISLGNPHRS